MFDALVNSIDINVYQTNKKQNTINLEKDLEYIYKYPK